VVLHSLRVENYVVKILEGEQSTVSPAERVVLQLAAILHDVGRIDGIQVHAKCSAAIVRTWLSEQSGIIEQISSPNKLYDLIETHSDKTSRPNDFLSGVLKDADILDEIGAMSVIMAQYRPSVDRTSPFFFHQLNEQLIKQEIPYLESKMEILNTQTAKKILSDRIAFIIQFINQINQEMQVTETINDPV